MSTNLREPLRYLSTALSMTYGSTTSGARPACSASDGSPCRANSRSSRVKSNRAFIATTGTPAAIESASTAATSEMTIGAGRPSARARALVIPCTADACSGMSMPGSASQV